VGFRLRAGRGTNLALLVLLIGALVTGGLAFAIGGGWAFWALAAHGAIGLALVLLAPWKSVISARGLRRARPGTAASLLLAALIVLTVASGVAHAVGWWTSAIGHSTRSAADIAAEREHAAGYLGLEGRPFDTAQDRPFDKHVLANQSHAS